jgi:hypothetical protein
VILADQQTISPCVAFVPSEGENIGGAHVNLQTILLLLSTVYACRPHPAGASFRSPSVDNMVSQCALVRGTHLPFADLLAICMWWLDTNRMNTSWSQNLLGDQN